MQKLNLIALVLLWVLTVCSTYMIFTVTIPTALNHLKGAENVVEQLVHIVGTALAIACLLLTWSVVAYLTRKHINAKKSNK